MINLNLLFAKLQIVFLVFKANIGYFSKIRQICQAI